MENQVVAKFYLRKEQAMLAMGLAPFSFGEEGGEAIEPLATTDEQIVCG